MAGWRSDMENLENPKRSPIAPQYPMAVLDDLAADDAVLTCDSGTIATWAARHWTIRGDRQFYLSGNLATMAPGPALRDRDPARLPRPAGHRLRR